MKSLIIFALLTAGGESRSDTLSDSLRLQLRQLQTEINAAFALYELQITTCLQAKNMIQARSLEALEHNLKEIQELKALLANQELSIAELQAIRLELQGSLVEINRLLKKLKRRMVIERIAGSAVISALTYILISRPP